MLGLMSGPSSLFHWSIGFHDPILRRMFLTAGPLNFFSYNPPQIKNYTTFFFCFISGYIFYLVLHLFVQGSTGGPALYRLLPRASHEYFHPHVADRNLYFAAFVEAHLSFLLSEKCLLSYS